MELSPSSLLTQLSEPGAKSAADRQLMRGQIEQIHWSRGEWAEWFAGLAQQLDAMPADSLAEVEWVARRALEQLGGRAKQWPSELMRATIDCYHQSTNYPVLSALILALLAAGPPAAQRAFAKVVTEAPPTNPAAVGLAFQPLFRQPARATTVFPALLDALSHASVAAAILDLANFLTRRQVVAEHPASSRRESLVELLGQLVRRLEYFEEERVESEEHYREVSRQVAEATGLTIALCDAVALMGESKAIGKLYPLLNLRHRRLQVEAAAALARLGEQAGRDKLIALTAEPVVRLHAVQYAEELQMGDQIPAEYRTEEARAAGRAALALAQPTYFGVPPSSIEVMHHRRLPWPGFEDPVQAFLVRYAYSTENGEWSNIACVGPNVGICTADLSDLPPDDIYAVFAGMETSHEDIRYWDAGEWSELHRAEVARLERRLRDESFHGITPHLLGNFFGDWLLIATVQRDGVPGIAWVDQAGTRWFPTTGSRPLGVPEVYALYKGRRLIRTFEKGEDSD